MVRSQNDNDALEKAESRLKEFTDLRDKYIAKFNKVCRALGIMLDDEVFELAVASKVRLRLNAVFKIHEEVDGDEPETQDALKYADALEHDSPFGYDDRFPADDDTPYGEQVTRLNKYLIRKDYFEDRSELETSIDNALSRFSVAESKASLPEISNLLRYLDRLGPSS